MQAGAETLMVVSGLMGLYTQVCICMCGKFLINEFCGVRLSTKAIGKYEGEIPIEL